MKKSNRFDDFALQNDKTHNSCSSVMRNSFDWLNKLFQQYVNESSPLIHCSFVLKKRSKKRVVQKVVISENRYDKKTHLHLSHFHGNMMLAKTNDKNRTSSLQNHQFDKPSENQNKKQQHSTAQPRFIPWQSLILYTLVTKHLK